MSISLQADPLLPQGYVLVDGQRSLTVTSTGLSAGSVSGSSLATSSVTQDKIAPITATGTLSARSLQDRFADIVNVKDFGAKGDGVTDDTAAVQNVISLGVPFIFTSGNYVVGTVTISTPVTFMTGAKILAKNGAIITFTDKIYGPNSIIFDGEGSYSISNSAPLKDYIKPEWFGVSGSIETTTATTVISSTAVTLANSKDFKNGQYISLEHAGLPSTLATPTSVSVSATGINKQGPIGSTTYSYRVAAVDETGAISSASAPVTITNGFSALGTISSTLRGVAFNVVRWTTTAPAAAVWRSKSSQPYELIGIFGLGQDDSIANGVMDAGLSAFSMDWIPASPPETSLNSRLITRIKSGEGTTSLVLTNAPLVSGSNIFVRHDDTITLTNLLSATNNINLPDGNYNVTSLTIPTNVSSIQGNGYNTNFIGWGARSAVLFASGMLNRFKIQDLRVYPTGWHNQIGIQINNTYTPIINNCYVSGNLPIFIANVNGAKITNNVVENWIDQGIFTIDGDANEITGNYIYPGCNAVLQNAAAIQCYNENSNIIRNNRTLGTCIYSVKVQDGNQCIIEDNWAYNTLAENYHIAGSSSGCRIKGNSMYSGPLAMDYAISISNDDVDNSVMYANEISENYIYGCGTAAIAVCEFGGLNPSITYTVVRGNTVFGANINDQPDTPEIFINGSNVTNTYVSDHHGYSSTKVDFIVKEVSADYGMPSNTQVGTIFGDSGSVGLVSLSGIGSSKLAGGGTGL